MSALVTAIADLIKTFCSGVVSLVAVPAQALQKNLLVPSFTHYLSCF